jgi:pseudaminic acid biosynthesis-associated methylase
MNARKEIKRLEELWSGEFGDNYVDRSKASSRNLGTFWKQTLTQLSVASVLEVGCNVGANLNWISENLDSQEIIGIDINQKALSYLHATHPSLNAIWSTAKDLPFKNERFDLTYTVGVLIHQPEESLLDVMREVVRCSKKYVLALEYFSLETEEVHYRGHEGALFKRNYKEIYENEFPNLSCIDQGEIGLEESSEPATYWIFEKK